MRKFDTRPSRIAGGAAVAGALVAVLVAALGSATSGMLAFVGLAMFSLGVRRGGSTALDGGSLVLFLAVVHAGVKSSSVELALFGAVGAVLAWDLANTARDVGRQLGRGASTTRLEVVRVLASVSVAVVAVTVGYLVSVVASGTGSNASLVTLVVTILFATIALGTGVRTVRARGRGEFRDV